MSEIQLTTSQSDSSLELTSQTALSVFITIFINSYSARLSLVKSKIGKGILDNKMNK